MKNILHTFSLLTLLSILLSGCIGENNDDAAAKSANQGLRTVDDGLPANAPTYLAITDAAYEPFSFRGEQGEVIGFDTDVLNAIAKNQKFRVKYMIQPWEEVLDSVKNGTRDIAAAGVRYTEQRAKTFTLSPPHLPGPDGMVWITPSLQIKNLEDIRDLKVSTLADSSFTKQLNELGMNEDDYLARKTLFLSFKDLLNGSAQVVTGDGVVLKHYVQQYSTKDRPIFYADYNIENIGEITFVMNKSNREFSNKVIAGMNNIKRNGTLDRIKAKWFGKNGQ